MKVDTIKTATFDVLKTLHVIEHDKILDGIFREGTSISYNVLRTMGKTKTINDEILGELEQIFDRLILPNAAMLKKYNKIVDEDVVPKVSRHYGKKRILEDIATTNQKTELDGAMIALNDMRNIYAALKRKCIKDKVNGTKILTQQDCRTIKAVLRLMENKFEPILNKKR